MGEESLLTLPQSLPHGPPLLVGEGWPQAGVGSFLL